MTSSIKAGVLFPLLFIFVGCNSYRAELPIFAPAVNRLDPVDFAIGSAVDWIINAETASGTFRYLYPAAIDETGKQENLPRQIGTAYALLRAYALTKDDPSLATIERFRSGITGAIRYDTVGTTAIAYLEEDDGRAKVNAQALYLLFLSEFASQGNKLSAREHADAKKILAGIKLMANEAGGFWYIYYLPEEKNRITPYGTGEVLLALVSYYRYIDPDPALLALADKHFQAYFSRSLELPFTNEIPRSFYHWPLLYLVEREAIEPGQEKYAAALIEKAMNFRASSPLCHEAGCILSPGSAGEAAFFEGTAAGLRLLQNNEYGRLKLRTEEYLEQAQALVLSKQLGSIADYERLTGKIYTGDPKAVIGGFCFESGCPYLRIDITQHSLLGLMNNNAIQ